MKILGVGYRIQPDQACERTQLFDAIGTAMSQLPPQYGSILVLWVHEGLDLNEIKERSGLSIAAIKSRIHRARGRVRQQIEHRFGEVALLAA